MTKKQLLKVIIILLFLCFICMFIYDKFKDEQKVRKTQLIVEKGDYQLSLYYTDSKDRNYYLYGLDKITVDYGDHSLELNKALEARQINMKTVINLIGNEKQESYWDGGSVKISNQDISLLQCSTTNGNHDYYFGPSNMEYKPGFCQDEPYICSFVKTYLVLDISDSKDKKYVYLTLKEGQSEEVISVKVDSNLIQDMVEDQFYEFTFNSLKVSDEENIKNIFDNYILKSITATDNASSNQINESICK